MTRVIGWGRDSEGKFNIDNIDIDDTVMPDVESLTCLPVSLWHHSSQPDKPILKHVFVSLEFMKYYTQLKFSTVLVVLSLNIHFVHIK